MKFLTFFLVFFSLEAFAQTPSVMSDSTSNYYVLIEGDSVPKTSINLEEVLILPKLRLRSRSDRRAYLILRRKTRKVFPYAMLAAQRLDSLKKRLELLPTKRKRKQYTRLVQRYINDEFKEELKKLSRTEGQILIKLVHRQTGITTFDLIKKLRSGWNAFWFNTTASLFKLSLKQEYNPLLVKEDYFIEDILQRDFYSGRYDYKKPAIEVNYFKAHEKWTAINPSTPTND